MSENACAGEASNAKPEILEQSEFNNIKHVIAVVSGKGGVGKSSVSALLAVGLNRQGYKVGILDADITGPSIPKMFGLTSPPGVLDNRIIPVRTTNGILVISLNLFLMEEDEPVIWRGPLLGSAVKQFWTDVIWGELDYLIIDLPPGTGDVPLTVMQSFFLYGLVVVTSPQDLAFMVVKKAVKMAGQMNIPILGMVENMSFLICPGCGKKIDLFGPGKAEETARTTGMKLLAVLPVDPKLAKFSDSGQIELYDVNPFNEINLIKE
ncbi:MAG TPA: ATP-binding protein [Desulfotomaculum sp.]|nr:MAG: ATPase-like, ParA/MinD [Desulfotomaculum sp. 46_80]HBY03534.1 ATP-binding protein [Desulfotomaculum sp.]